MCLVSFWKPLCYLTINTVCMYLYTCKVHVIYELWDCMFVARASLSWLLVYYINLSTRSVIIPPQMGNCNSMNL